MAKRKPSKKHVNKIHTIYEIKGNAAVKKNKSCPKCGAGVFLAAHKDRLYCGRCHYTEFKAKEK